MSPAGGHVRLEGLTKAYGAGPRAVDGFDLAVERGEFLALLGPSGCGKTTCLRMIAGLIAPTAGRVFVGGTDVTALPAFRRNMGFVFQSYALFPHLDAADNVAFGLEMRGLPAAERGSRVAEALRLVRLEGYERRRPRELSGGQQQRVALARALVIRPELLLLDESLSNLDAKLREEMRGEVREIQRALGITTIFVTHDQVEALSMCDRVAVMVAGRLAQLGTPEDVYERPASRFVADFVGRTNALRGRVRGGRVELEGGASVAASRLPADGTEVDLMIRPHRVSLGGDGGANALEGRVKRVVYVGDVVQIEVETPAGRVLVERGTRGGAWRDVVAGAAVRVSWAPEDTLVFARGQA